METYVKINGALYPAEVIGRKSDTDWDGRESKTITMEMSYDVAASIFLDKLSWSIVVKDTVSTPVTDELGNLVLVDGKPSITTHETEQEYDNSDFGVAGSITDLRNGKIQVKMGKTTDRENMEKVSQSLIILAGKYIQESDVYELRKSFEVACSKLSDADILIAPSLAPSWDIGQNIAQGERRYYRPNDTLHKALKPHTASFENGPGNTEYWEEV